MPETPKDGGARPALSCGSTVLATPGAPCDEKINGGDLLIGSLEGAGTPG